MVKKSKPFPWEGDSELRDRLSDAGFRYAALIGIVDADAASGSEVLAADRTEFASFIRTENGTPVYHTQEAVGFVQAVTDLPLEVCDQWMMHDWDADPYHPAARIDEDEVLICGRCGWKGNPGGGYCPQCDLDGIYKD